MIKISRGETPPLQPPTPEIEMAKIKVSELASYLDELDKNPAEKAAFNAALRRAERKERKRKGGEFAADFLSAIRIP